MADLAAVILFDKSKTCEGFATDPITIALDAGEYEVFGTNSVTNISGTTDSGLNYYLNYTDGTVVASNLTTEKFALSEKSIVKIYPTSRSNWLPDAWIAIRHIK